MGFFDWLRRRWRRPALALAVPEPAAASPTPLPENIWQVGCDDGVLWALDPKGARRSLPVSQVGAIAIETNDSGPIGIDFWWLFYGSDEDVALVLPLGAAGEGAVVEQIAALPGFRHEAYAAAVRSTDIDTFVVWQGAPESV